MHTLFEGLQEQIRVLSFFSVVARMFAPSVGTMMDGEHAFATIGGTAWRRRQRRLSCIFARFVLWTSKMEVAAALHHRQRTSTTAAATQTMNCSPDLAATTYSATTMTTSARLSGTFGAGDRARDARTCCQ